MTGLTSLCDGHVHTQHSWDASTGDMTGACRRAVALGLPVIAFTDHADHTPWALHGATVDDDAVVRVIDTHATTGLLDVDTYAASIERCRRQFPDLRVLSGVELGEPHVFAQEADALLRSYDFDRVLGALHHLKRGDGRLVYAPRLLREEPPVDVMREYLRETQRMVESGAGFTVLAHLDYPMRAWPPDAEPYDARVFEEEYRAVLSSLAASDRALELNTAGPWPDDAVLTWWSEEGGRAVTFGSDAHEPAVVGSGFETAAAMAQAAGYRPGRDPGEPWRR